MTLDPDKIAEAAAKMRKPQLRLNPVTLAQLFDALAPEYMTPEDRERAEALERLRVIPMPDLPVVSDDTVEEGHAWLVDMDSGPMFLQPPPIEPEVFEAMDRLRSSTFIGMDLGYSPSVGVMGTYVPGIGFVDVRPVPHVRRPWKLVGRAATRARWRRCGRR